MTRRFRPRHQYQSLRSGTINATSNQTPIPSTGAAVAVGGPGQRITPSAVNGYQISQRTEISNILFSTSLAFGVFSLNLWGIVRAYKHPEKSAGSSETESNTST